jgi:hypothetical protein
MEVKRYIVYRGRRVSVDWPEQVREAQAETTIALREEYFQRIRYGSEPEDWGAKVQPCGDCCVINGEFHVPGCDIERCPRCSGQLISCGCWDVVEAEDLLCPW